MLATGVTFYGLAWPVLEGTVIIICNMMALLDRNCLVDKIGKYMYMKVIITLYIFESVQSIPQALHAQSRIKILPSTQYQGLVGVPEKNNRILPKPVPVHV